MDITITTRISKELHKKLKQQAKAKGMIFSIYLRLLIEKIAKYEVED